MTLTPDSPRGKPSTPLGKIQMIDVHLPTTDGRAMLLRRRTEPNAEQQLLLSQLKLTLPEPPPPRIREM